MMIKKTGFYAFGGEKHLENINRDLISDEIKHCRLDELHEVFFLLLLKN